MFAEVNIFDIYKINGMYLKMTQWKLNVKYNRNPSDSDRHSLLTYKYIFMQIYLTEL